MNTAPALSLMLTRDPAIEIICTLLVLVHAIVLNPCILPGRQSDLQSDPPHGDDHMELLERTQTSEVPEVVLASGGIGPGTGDLPEAPGLSAPSTSIEDALRSAISKGKGRAAPEDETPRINPAVIHQLENLEIWPSGSICGICGEGFRKAYNPLEASLSASGSSDPVLYGLSLTCPGKHEYCLSCMTSYVRIKLEGESGTIFPIRCPECPRDVTWELYDEMAMVLLGKDLLDAWFFQRLLASLPVVRAPLFRRLEKPLYSQLGF